MSAWVDTTMTETTPIVESTGAGMAFDAALHFSSETVEWYTPQDFFDELDAEFGFELDVCATAENAKCAKFFTKEDDGLSRNWTGICWCNPPYGRGIGDWVKKAYDSSLSGATVVCLVPARTDTKWFQDYCLPYGEVRFVRGRLKFGGCVNPAPFPCAVVIFRPDWLAEVGE